MTIRRLRPGAVVELECKHFVSEGLGLSYFIDEAEKEKYKPHVFFIWGVLPGERFSARIAKVKSKFAHGVLVELKTASPHRVKPACENFLYCGGCKMQHMDYDDTLGYKKEWLLNQIRHHKVETPEPTLDRAPDHELMHYRNHIQVHINKFGVYGFYEPMSYRTRAFPEHGCLIFDEKSLRDKFPTFPVEVRASRIRLNTDGAAVFTELNAKIEADTRMTYSVSWPPGQTTEIEFPVPQFFQVNLRILPRWLEAMAGFIAPFANNKIRVLELFSGFGFISRMLACKFDFEILAADLLARADVERVQLRSGAELLSADFAANYHRVDLFLPEKISPTFLAAVGAHKPDLMIVNPPRAGLNRDTWNKLRSEALQNFTGPILYSSCNAATMARDLGYLIGEGYRVREMRLFDFFPWTHHFETVALLTR